MCITDKVRTHRLLMSPATVSAVLCPQHCAPSTVAPALCSQYCIPRNVPSVVPPVLHTSGNCFPVTYPTFCTVRCRSPMYRTAGHATPWASATLPSVASPCFTLSQSVLGTVSSAPCPKHCVLVTVSSALCPRHCVLGTVSSALCPRHCVLGTVSLALCPWYCAVVPYRSSFAMPPVLYP